MSSNHRFMVYTRDDGGRITREHRTVTLSASEIKNGYQHAEKLIGWPETIVYWNTEYGIGNGLAPLSRAAADLLGD